MARLTINNIKEVIVYEKDGVAFAYTVRAKSSYRDNRRFQIYRNNVSTTEEFKEEWLPVSVRRFLDSAMNEEIIYEDDYKGSHFTHWRVS